MTTAISGAKHVQSDPDAAACRFMTGWSPLLYLENNLAPRAFTPPRLTVLKFLASEAATSAYRQCARLYRELQERRSKIRRLGHDSNVIGIHIFDEEGVIVDANRSFLMSIGYDREDLIARAVALPHRPDAARNGVSTQVSSLKKK